MELLQRGQTQRKAATCIAQHREQAQTGVEACSGIRATITPPQYLNGLHALEHAASLFALLHVAYGVSVQH